MEMNITNELRAHADTISSWGGDRFFATLESALRKGASMIERLRNQHEELVDEIEDLKTRLAVYESAFVKNLKPSSSYPV